MLFNTKSKKQSQKSVNSDHKGHTLSFKPQKENYLLSETPRKKISWNYSTLSNCKLFESQPLQESPQNVQFGLYDSMNRAEGALHFQTEAQAKLDRLFCSMSLDARNAETYPSIKPFEVTDTKGYLQNLNIDFGSTCQSPVMDSKAVSDVQMEDFEKIKFLGKGKFGEVYLVKHNLTGFICALKSISKRVIRQEKLEKQISNEIRIHESLRHMNIIEFYGFFDDESYMYILMEYATDGELFGKLKLEHRLSEYQGFKLIREICEGLKMIHGMGYIHRDIKPENIVLQLGLPKICDLGWAAECNLFETRKSFCGTPLYLAPELVRKEEYGHLIDVWAIGLLAYELVVGKLPFSVWTEDNLHHILEKEIEFPEYVDISTQAMDFIHRCLEKNPNNRWDLAHMLDHSALPKKLQSDSQYNLRQEIDCLFN